MYINLQPTRTKIGWGSDEGSEATYTVSSKEHGSEGHLHVTEQNGEGVVEWCKDSTAQGYGVKVSVAELLEWMESKATQ
jgi:hypothetical protein